MDAGAWVHMGEEILVGAMALFLICARFVLGRPRRTGKRRRHNQTAGPARRLQAPPGGFKIPAMIVYDRGVAAFERRNVLINSLHDGVDFHTNAATMNIRAYCFTLGRELTFRVDRIVELIDGETCEIVPSPLAWIEDAVLQSSSRTRSTLSR